MRNPIMYGNVTPSNQLDIIEFAKEVKISEPVLLSKVAIFLKHVALDSASMRINFYSVMENAPGERLVTKEVLVSSKVTKGWFEVDLSAYEIELNQSFFIGFEYIPIKEKFTSRTIYYGGKMGGGLYTRSTSLGEWESINGVTLTAYIEYWE